MVPLEVAFYEEMLLAATIRLNDCIAVNLDLAIIYPIMVILNDPISTFDVDVQLKVIVSGSKLIN
jgi:hypothetical protein